MLFTFSLVMSSLEIANLFCYDVEITSAETLMIISEEGVNQTYSPPSVFSALISEGMRSYNLDEIDKTVNLKFYYSSGRDGIGICIE